MKKIIITLIIILLNSNTVYSKEPYEEYYLQEAKFIDCQAIKTDTSFLPTKYKNKDKEELVCFWSIQVMNKSFVMWKNLTKKTSGFIKDNGNFK